MKRFLLLPFFFVLAFAFRVTIAEDFHDLRRDLSAHLPQVTVGEIRKLPDSDLYEVQWNGTNVFYTDAHGDLGLFGSLVDLKTKINLSEARKSELLQTDFSALPLDMAFEKVKGDGSRKLAVFSDPDCPYCKQLEQELAGVTNVTIYTFLFPLAQLHPDAPRKARAVWCAPDRAKAWDDLMLDGKEPGAPVTDCEAPLGDISEVARKLWILGTPGIVFGNGRLVPGVVPGAQIEMYLNAGGGS